MPASQTPNHLHAGHPVLMREENPTGAAPVLERGAAPVVNLFGREFASSAMRRADGRGVVFSEFGDPVASDVLFYCHGGGSCRFEAASGHAVALAEGVRIVAFDRPGFGRSDPLPGRRFVDAARDASDLARLLGIERCAIAGCSSGAPHALAAVLDDPQRFVGAIAINSAGERAHPAWRRQPLMTRLAVDLLIREPIYRRVMARMLRQLQRAGSGPGADANAQFLVAIFAEGSRQGIAEVMHEAALCYQQPWGLDWSALERPVLALHGAADLNLRFLRAVAEGAPMLDVEAIPGGHMDGFTPQVWRRVCQATRDFRRAADARAA